MKVTHILGVLPLALLFSACVEDIAVIEHTEPTTLVFSPANGVLPLPNDALFLGTEDLTLNFPPATDPAQQPLFDALNALDRWSTTSPMSFSCDAPIEGNLMDLMSSVHLFEVQTLGQTAAGQDAGVPPIGGPVAAVVEELTAGVDFMPAPLSDDPSNTGVVVVPLAPLKPSTSYMMVVTNGINDANGDPISYSSEYFLCRYSEPYADDHPYAGLRTLVNAMEAAAEGEGIVKDDIILTMTFTTQSIGAALETTFAIANGQEALILGGLCATAPVDCSAGTDPDPNSTASFGGAAAPFGTTANFGLAGLANVITETFTTPYYLTGPTNSGGLNTVVDFNNNMTAAAPLVSYWTSRYPFLAASGDTDRNVTGYNPVPNVTRQETIPVIVTTPVGAPPAGGWPCAIYQHGITQNRTEVLAIADSLAARGIACVAIDLPLHGVVDEMNPFFVGWDTDQVHERNFGLDIAGGVSDGVVDGSGDNFINFTSLRTNRDNLSQAATDLFNLTAQLPALDVIDNATGAVGGDGTPDVDMTKLHFIGNSLGAIVGTPFLSIQQSNAPVFSSVTLAAPSGSIPNLLIASESYGPIIEAGLGALGLTPGSAEWNQFVLAACTVTDSSDAINFASSFNTGGSAENTNIHVIEFVGGGDLSGDVALPDQVVPNFVATAPLAGTEPIVALMGQTPFNGFPAPGPSVVVGSKSLVRFQEGSHSSLVNPVDLGGAVTAEAQNQMATFADSGGTEFEVISTELLYFD